MKLRATVLALTTASQVACYTYTPVRIDAISPGETVRARLTAEASERLPAPVRADDGTLEGELLDRDGGGVTLFVESAVRQRGFFAEDLHERVSLSQADVLGVERRQLDRGRTWALGGVVGVAVVSLAIRTLSGKAGGNTIDHTDGGPSASLIPLVTLRIR